MSCFFLELAELANVRTTSPVHICGGPTSHATSGEDSRRPGVRGKMAKMFLFWGPRRGLGPEALGPVRSGWSVVTESHPRVSSREFGKSRCRSPELLRTGALSMGRIE